MAADRPPRFARFIGLLIGLWIVVYWITPGPGAPGGADIAFQDDAPTPAQPQPDLAPSIEFSAPPEAAPRTPPQADDQDSQQPPDLTDPSILVEAPSPDDSESAVEPPSFYIYYSERNDTFQSIARKEYGSVNRWRSIARANPDVDPNRLGPGTRLLIPLDPDNVQGRQLGDAGQAQGPEESQFTEYIVSRGDTLSGIAKALYGRATLWRRIAEANPEIDPDRLRLGDTLRIPPPPAPE